MSNKLLSVKESATILGVHWQTVRNYIDRGELKSHKIGKLVKISRTDLDEFICGAKMKTYNVEVELRYKIADLLDFQKKILDLKGTLVQQTHIIDHWYIPINIKNMAQEIEWFDKNRNTGIRIREFINEYGSQISTTLETKRLTLALNHDTCLETSMNVDNYQKAHEFLEMIDRKEYLTIDKSRIVYRVDKFEICLDSIKDYGSGVEIEYQGVGERAKIVREIEEFAKKLGLTSADRFEKSLTVDSMEVLAKF